MGSAGPSKGDLLTVYEALNETRGEIYVGTTWRVEGLEALQKLTRPRSIGHWAATDQVRFRIVEPGLPAPIANAFVAQYRKLPEMRRWKVLADSPL